MKVSVEKLEKNFVKLTVEVPSADVDKAVEKSVRKIAKQTNIPGFRKGKAPRSILEARFGKDAILAEALDELLPEAYEQALDESDIKPIDRPDIDNLDPLNEGETYTFTAKVQVMPDVELGDYKSVRRAKEIPVVTDEDIDNEIESMRDRLSELVSVEKEALEEGDFAVIDFEGSVEGVESDGLSSDGYTLEIGSGQFIPGFEDQLVGMKTGEEKEIKVTFPEDYQSEDLAGKEATFKVKVNDIREKKLPDLDDDFAKDVGKYESFADLKEKTKTRLESAAATQAEQEYEEGLVSDVVDLCNVELPDILVDRTIDSMMNDTFNRLRYQGIDKDQYMQLRQISEDDLRNEFRGSAQQRVKADLVLDEVAKAENITVTDEQLDEYLENMGTAYGKTLEEMKKYYKDQGALESLRESLKSRQTLDFLKNLASGADETSLAGDVVNEAEDVEYEEVEPDVTETDSKSDEDVNGESD